MAWTKEARIKAVESRRNSVRKNQWCDPNYVITEKTRTKLSIAASLRTHTEESKKKISEGALKSNHRRLVKSVRNYTKPDGSVIQLDSSWEEILAKRLDILGVLWERPDPIKWKDDTGKIRNYFPDFFLPDYNLYLDPKNPQAYKSQEEKIKCLIVQIPNLIIIQTIDECKNYCPVRPTDRTQNF